MNKTTLLLGAIAIVLIGSSTYWVVSLKESSKGGLVTSQTPAVTSGENPTPGGIHNMPVEPAAASARKELAAKLAVDEKSIVIMQITDTTWNDGCLGLGGPTESCLQASVPGFKVEMLVGGKTYFYRTDKTGTVIRTR